MVLEKDNADDVTVNIHIDGEKKLNEIDRVKYRHTFPLFRKIPSYFANIPFIFCSRYLVNILYWLLLLLLLYFFLLLLLLIFIRIHPNSLRSPCVYFEQRQITYKVHTRYIHIYIEESIETYTSFSLSLFPFSAFSYTRAYIDQFVLKKNQRRRRRHRRRLINEYHCRYSLFFVERFLQRFGLCIRPTFQLNQYVQTNIFTFLWSFLLLLLKIWLVGVYFDIWTWTDI